MILGNKSSPPSDSAATKNKKNTRNPYANTRPSASKPNELIAENPVASDQAVPPNENAVVFVVGAGPVGAAPK